MRTMLADAAPGMILRSPAVNHQGQVLLPAGAEIAAKHLRILRSWGVRDEDVEEPAAAPEKTVEVLLSSDRVAARTDPDLTRRILENLLGNALKFSPPGGRVTIRIGRISRDGREVLEMSVQDRGEGIPADYLDRIFQKFVQVESRQHGRKLGTGLGLTFCRLAAEAQGGTIRVESAPGQGSTFTVTLAAVP